MDQQVIERRARKRGHKNLTQRGGMWHLYVRVPVDFAHVDDRTFVIRTTGVKVGEDPHGDRAGMVARMMLNETKRYWVKKAQGATEALEAEYEDACRRCRMLGIVYTDINALAAGDPLERANRLLTVKKELRNVEANDDPRLGPNVPAVTGGVERVVRTVLISGMAELFKTVKAPDLINKDQQQIDKLHRPMVLVADELKNVVGDMDLSALTDEHAAEFMEWWDRRIERREVTRETANVHFASLKGMWNLLNGKKKWGLNKYLWASLRYKKLKGGTGIEKPRLPFGTATIQKWLTDDAIGDLGAEARDAFYVMVETGLRNKEFLSLRRKRVHLDGAIPYVEIRPDGVELKTDNSFRVMPLVGIALDAIKRRLAVIDADPDALLFPSYWPNRDDWSRGVNDYLTAKDLRGPKQSAYSLRHSLEDRMVKAGLERDMRDFVMGHKLNKNQEYGVGPDLVLQHEWLTKIAFTV